MIFVTVGGQKPFDRLVHCVDAWAVGRPGQEVFAQIGASENPPGHVRWERFVSPTEFVDLAREADVIVSHAGMGTILTAAEVGTPIIVMPRQARLGEHRNDHQFATVRGLREVSQIPIADDETALPGILDALDRLEGTELQGGSRERLVTTLRDFIAGAGT